MPKHSSALHPHFICVPVVSLIQLVLLFVQDSLRAAHVAFDDKSQEIDVRLETLEDLGVEKEEEKTMSVEQLNRGEHQEVVEHLKCVCVKLLPRCEG